MVQKCIYFLLEGFALASLKDCCGMTFKFDAISSALMYPLAKQVSGVVRSNPDSQVLYEKRWMSLNFDDYLQRKITHLYLCDMLSLRVIFYL